ncbi:HAT family dimerization domain-containing protein [Mycena sanguinolenta]|uniref:HAT family dimerization domain-containing protein n=1 Tax=Mycena sanguinolenta TaxID=230812 RepID=A0A8H6X666_9AGAR|nr:HAT family dimerization domain-containing protein [Mycena sanguinolenta]
MCIYDGVAHGEFSSQCLPAEEEVLKVLQTILLELRPQHNLCPVLSVHVELLLVQTKPHRHLLLQCRQGGGEANHNRHRQRMPLGRSESHWSTLSVETTLKKRHDLMMSSTMMKTPLLPVPILITIPIPVDAFPRPFANASIHLSTPASTIPACWSTCFPAAAATPQRHKSIWFCKRCVGLLRAEGTAVDAEKRVLILQRSANPHVGTTKFSTTTSTGVLRKHLYEHHLEAWVEGCDQLKIPITAKEAAPHVEQYRIRKNQKTGSTSTQEPGKKRTKFSQEAFVDAIVEWIVSDDQSINVAENQQLRNIFLMLRSELKDSDIPHRTKIRQRVMEIWDEHLDKLESEMAAAIGKISTTMDLWTDQKKRPFMAVTGHWLEATLVDTPSGPQYVLKLRTDLIGFLRVPGNHDGEHLATAFLYIIDRIGITSKLGWVTLDNASNNDTFMTWLEIELQKRKIPFRKLHRRIRCFPHIVNLAVKAVLSAITDMDFAAPEAEDFVPNPTAPQTVLDAIARDPIATVRTTIRASSLRRQYFSEVLKALQKKDLQLLRDVDTRWSSTLIMIERAILLREAIDRFLSDNQFQDLHKYKLNDKEWEALTVFKRILAVPHAFQQLLSAEGTPTLGDALPSFELMILRWEEQRVQYPETAHIVQQGIDKLEAYRERVEDVPAYILSMLINPAVKLSWFEKNRPEQVRTVKDLFLRELEGYRTDPTDTPAEPLAPSSWANEILGMNTPGRPTRRQSLRDEVDGYLMEPLSNFGSVRYWQDNQLRHPTIFALAIDYLPIQGSAVPCERVFSSSGETDTVRRSRIAPDLMEALQMLKFSVKKGRSLNFTAGTSLEDEIALMETEAEDQGLVPEDPTGYNSFIQALLETEYDSE